MELKEKIEKLGQVQAWNHSYDFGNGVTTPVNTSESYGKNINKWQRIEPILAQLLDKEKKVLDIGSNDGFFSLKMAELSKEVLGLDVDEHRIEKAEFAKSIFKYENVKFSKLNILNEVDASTLGRFDVCVCLGVLHRLPNPFLLLVTLANKSDTLLLEWKTHLGVGLEEAGLFFSPATPKPNDPYGEQFFLPTAKLVTEVLYKNGFNHYKILNRSNSNRALLVASRNKLDHMIFESESSTSSKLHRFKLLTKGYLRNIQKIFNS